MYFTIEKWGLIKGFEREYIISNQGRVASLRPKYNKIIVSQRIDRAGYMTVRLSKDGISHTKYVHRLVAETFIPNPDNKLYVNHLTGKKTDNRFFNLYWVTHSENIQHAYNVGLIKHNGLKVVDSCSGKFYKSIIDAATDLNISYGSLKNMLSGRRKNSSNLAYLS